MLELKKKNLKKQPVWLFFFTILLVNTYFFALAKTSICEILPKPTIAINPGHGGHDVGTHGPGGLLEKNVTLALANLIAKKLSEKYKPILTRTDDYFITIPVRTSIANNNKASLFLSIHTSGSYGYKSRGITIFYFKDTTDTVFLNEASPPFDINDNLLSTPWNEIHKNFIVPSRDIGKMIQKRLSQNSRFSENRLLNAPILVLNGSSMPAALIETGYLTDPIIEKKLRDAEYLSTLATEICMGIDDFFDNSRTPQ